MANSKGVVVKGLAWVVGGIVLFWALSGRTDETAVQPILEKKSLLQQEPCKAHKEVLLVEELSEMQGTILKLKVALEKLKLQREFERLQQPKQPQDIGRRTLSNLTLKGVYGTSKYYFVTFSYDEDLKCDARLGDYLPCGARVVKIASDCVEIVKEGQRYQVTATAVMPVRNSMRAADCQSGKRGR